MMGHTDEDEAPFERAERSNLPIKRIEPLEALRLVLHGTIELLFSVKWALIKKRRISRPSVALITLLAVVSGLLLTKIAYHDTTRLALVISSHRGQDVSWLGNISKAWEVYLYEADNPDAHLTVPSKHGREAMAYTTFIVDHYEDLPDYMVFVHGHNRSWHQPQSIVAKLRALNLTAVRQEGYVSLRCWQFPACTPESYVNMSAPERDPIGLVKLTPAFFRYAFQDDEMELMPEAFGGPCCAQFAVTRGAVRNRSLKFWDRLRAPMLEEGMTAYTGGAMRLDDWHVGALFEHTWHYFFGKPAIDCPSESYCRKVLFSDKVHCENKGNAFFESVEFWKDPDNVRCWYGNG